MAGIASPERRSLRDEHREATRRRILQALVELLADEHPAAISVPAVAARSAVSLATLYRYFPTKELLLDAAATYGEELGNARVGGNTLDIGRAERFLRPVWNQLLEIRSLMEAQRWSPLGRDIRRRRSERRRADVEAQLAAMGIGVSNEAGKRLRDLVLLLISSSALLELHDHSGLGPEAAADDVAWAIQALIEATCRETPIIQQGGAP